MRTVQTSRFGAVEVEEHRVIHFPKGLLGFPDQKDFALLEDQAGSPFFWLQSIDQPELAFILTNPFFFKKDYLQGLSGEEQTSFHDENGQKMVLFTLVSVPSGYPEEASTNLLSPILIHTGSRTGRQVVLPHTGYSHRHPLFDAHPDPTL